MFFSFFRFCICCLIPILVLEKPLFCALRLVYVKLKISYIHFLIYYYFFYYFCNFNVFWVFNFINFFSILLYFKDQPSSILDFFFFDFFNAQINLGLLWFLKRMDTLILFWDILLTFFFVMEDWMKEVC